jgi:hypothetical protein
VCSYGPHPRAGRKLASQRRLVELDFTLCYAAYDQNVDTLTAAVKSAYDKCVAGLGGACRRPWTLACTSGLTACWNTFKTDTSAALAAAKVNLDICIADVKTQLQP